MSWKIFPLRSKKYDAIIWINFLLPYQANIDVKHQELEIFSKYKIPFENVHMSYEIAQANPLEAITDSTEEIHNKINQSHLNEEERRLIKDLLIRNKDLFYYEEDNLTFNHEITHEIRTTNENLIYCKISSSP